MMGSKRGDGWVHGAGGWGSGRSGPVPRRSPIGGTQKGKGCAVVAFGGFVAVVAIGAEVARAVT